MMELGSRLKQWLERLASFSMLVAATVVFNSLLDAIVPSTARVLGLSLQLVGSFGLAMFTLGMGALAVTGCRLAINRKTTDAASLQRLIDQHVTTVAQVLGGVVVLLFYFCIRS